MVSTIKSITMKYSKNYTNWGKWQKGYRQIKSKKKACQEVDFDSVTEQLQSACQIGMKAS